MLNAQETEAAVRNLPSIFDLPKDARDERVALDLRNREAVKGYEAQFRAYLEHKYASQVPEAAYDVIFGRAWSYGHGNGYNEVELYYQDLADIALVSFRAK